MKSFPFVMETPMHRAGLFAKRRDERHEQPETSPRHNSTTPLKLNLSFINNFLSHVFRLSDRCLACTTGDD